ncbi:MAG: matrixin family metalloprotease [Planctomycetota bacterium]
MSSSLPKCAVLLLLVAIAACDEAPRRVTARGSAGDPDSQPRTKAAARALGHRHFTLRGPCPFRGRVRYRIEATDGPIPATDFAAALERAMEVWRAPVRAELGIELEATTDREAEIVLRWSRPEESSGALFHAVHDALARASSLGETAWIAFDRRRDWSGPEGFDPYAVAVHEIGHLFGLDHSLDEEAVMHAAYDRGHQALGESDLAALRALGSSARRLDDLGPGDLVVRGEALGEEGGLVLRGLCAAGVGVALLDLDRDGNTDLLTWQSVYGEKRQVWTLYRFGPEGWLASEGPAAALLPLGGRVFLDLDEEGTLFAIKPGAGRRYGATRFDGSPLFGDVVPPRLPVVLECGLVDRAGDGEFEEGDWPEAPWPPRDASGAIVPADGPADWRLERR